MASEPTEDNQVDVKDDDLLPLYPSFAHLTQLLSTSSGLTTTHKSSLVRHCLTRACIFGDISVLRYIVQDSSCQPYVDLNIQDDDGLPLVTIAIVNFADESERDVEREECVRLLVSEGANVNVVDNGERCVSALL